jgi:tetratricopeptide (TPR) repeat protein
LGDWPQADRALHELLQNQAAPLPPAEFIGATELYLGEVLTDLAKPADAEVHLRRAVDLLTHTLGATRARVAQAQAALGRALADASQYDEAAAELDKAQELAARSAAAESWNLERARYFRALLFLQLDQPQQAEPILLQILGSRDAASAADPQTHAGSAQELDRTAAVQQTLGEVYARQGKFDEAIATLQRAVAARVRADGPRHPAILSARIALAESLLAIGRDAEARALLATPPLDLAALPAVHPIAAELDRVKGLLAQRDGDVAQARKWFASSLAIQQALYGPQQWRVLRARRELQSVDSPRALGGGDPPTGMPTPVT